MKILTVACAAWCVALTFVVGITSTFGERLPRIDLVQEANVVGSEIVLADLLPAETPNALRTRAAEVSLGAAPSPGSLRVFLKESLERVVAASGGEFADLNLPDRVVVSRKLRPISQTEVFMAIRAALQLNGISAEALREEDVHLQSEVFVTHADARLQVMKMDVDPRLRIGKFVMWSASDPKVLPFLVTADLPSDTVGEHIALPKQSRDSVRQKDGSAGLTQHIAPEQLQNLVTPGARATLSLHSGSLHMLLDVVSLEKDGYGQQVHVRLNETGKTLIARVDGDAHLDGTF